jgi:hypothetical protein
MRLLMAMALMKQQQRLSCSQIWMILHSLRMTMKMMKTLMMMMMRAWMETCLQPPMSLLSC